MIWTMMQGFGHFKSSNCYGNLKFIHKFIQCDYITCNYYFESFSHIIHLYFVPWPMIDNLTNCDNVMYSTLVCFHP
jgi:hypothetical protein